MVIPASTGPAGSADGAAEIDGLTPTRRVQPDSLLELTDLLRHCSSEKLAVTPVGGGRALGMGGRLQRLDVVVSTVGLRGISEYQPADLTVTVRAGTTLGDLSDELRAAGQFLPLDPFASPGHTVGGLLASGWSGPLRQGYRHARDFVIGLTVARADGTLISSGGRVVKNVSGYDMHKLHLGVLGSLGVIVQASFKVSTIPHHDLTVGRCVADRTSAWAEAERALALALPPVALELLSPAAAKAGGWGLVARLCGSREAVARSRRELGWPEGDPGFWEAHARRTATRWARIAVPARQLAKVCRELGDAETWWASPGVGVAHWLDWQPAAVVAARQSSERASGSLALLAAPPQVKDELGAWGTLPPEVRLMSRVRDRFDPDRLLSPGRYPI